ncbi:MAG: sigma-54 dependent transcriptional regulator [Bdellovibrionota bacterium]
MSKLKFGNTAAAMEAPTTHASTYLDFIQSQRGIRTPPPSRDKKLFQTADEKMMRIQDIVWQIADTNVPVLISGESGSGKDVIAKSIHEAATNKEMPFVTINCSSVAKNLLEGELFGIEEGAFAGAPTAHIGKFEQANNGILVIDEITELDLDLQTKLLKALQDREIQRIGAKSNIKVNTRVIATTNKDIMALIANGSFRQDLYYRLYVIHLQIPALRDRPKDIELLSKHFLGECGYSFGKTGLVLADDAIEKLKEYQWPGNVRELQNVIQRAVVLADSNIVTAANIPIEGMKKPVSMDWIDELPIGQTLRTVETHFILETLKNHSGNRTHAAKTLGISLRTLRNKINEFTAQGYEVIAPQNGRCM